MPNKNFKQNILSDYITILSAKSFCNLCSELSLDADARFILKIVSKVAERLHQAYMKILFKLEMIDLSLAILNKELQSPFENSLADLKKLETKKIIDSLEKYNQKLQKISLELQGKLDKLGLNSFEAQYLKLNNL